MFDKYIWFYRFNIEICSSWKSSVNTNEFVTEREMSSSIFPFNFNVLKCNWLENGASGEQTRD